MRLTAVDKPAAWSVMRVLRWQRCCSCSWYLQPLRASRSCRSSQSMACSACHTLTTLHALLTELQFGQILRTRTAICMTAGRAAG